jgi:glycosyltransferase involved in cell wall biosynthesis
VEEAKSLGKFVVVSDIPVHREQAPARGMFFDPSDPNSLANILLDILQIYRKDIDAICMQEARMNFLVRRLDFARRYEEIVNAVIEG